jgi:hypothetical protein
MRRELSVLSALVVLGGLVPLPAVAATRTVRSGEWTIVWDESAGYAQRAGAAPVVLYAQPGGQARTSQTFALGAFRCPVGHDVLDGTPAIYGQVLSVVGTVVSYYVCRGRTEFMNDDCGFDDYGDCAPSETTTSVEATFRTIELSTGREMTLGTAFGEQAVLQALLRDPAVKKHPPRTAVTSTADLLRVLMPEKRVPRGAPAAPILGISPDVSYAFVGTKDGRAGIRVALQVSAAVTVTGEFNLKTTEKAMKRLSVPQLGLYVDAPAAVITALLAADAGGTLMRSLK